MALRFVSQCGWRLKRKSHGEFCHARALCVFAYSDPDAYHARLDFRQGRNPGSFPKQGLVIEPTARKANTLAKANTSVRSPTKDIWPPFNNPHCNPELEGNSCVIIEMKLHIRNHQLVMFNVNRDQTSIEPYISQRFFFFFLGGGGEGGRVSLLTLLAYYSPNQSCEGLLRLGNEAPQTMTKTRKCCRLCGNLQSGL